MKRKKNKQKRVQRIRKHFLNIIFVAILHLLDNDNGERRETGNREGYDMQQRSDWNQTSASRWPAL